MSDVREATESLLADKPDLESDLRTLLDLDADAPWEFEEIPLDSGKFGEIVAHGLVEEHDGGYVLADRGAIEAALEDQTPSTKSDETTSPAMFAPDFADLRMTLVRRRVSLFCLIGLLATTVVLRTVFSYGDVFRPEHIVMGGNDPYLYIYWLEFLLDSQFSITSVASLQAFPPGIAKHDVLFIVTLWWVVAPLGGTSAAGAVLAWYPVVTSVLVALAVYAIALRVTADRRVGVASVAMFAVTPVLAYRMMIGFADHDAFDLLWLAITLLALVILVRRISDSGGAFDFGDAGIVVVLGFSVAAQTMAWRGGPLLLAPLLLAIVFIVLSALRRNDVPWRFLLALAGSLVFATGVSMSVHLAFGWLQFYRAATPALMLAALVLVAVLAGVVQRYRFPLRFAVGIATGVGVASVLLMWHFVPPLAAGLSEFIDYMAAYTWGDIVETRSLFAAGFGTIFGPVLFLGFGFVFGAGGLVVKSWAAYRQHRPRWLVLIAYGWYFLCLSIVQSRFAVQFAVINAVFAGIAFVHLANVVDLTAPVSWFPSTQSTPQQIRTLSIPDRKTVVYVGLLFLLVSSIGLVQIPVKQSQIAIDDERYTAATYIEDYAAEHDRDYPRNYVFSQWDRNRFYNYVVNGESRSYEYAQDNYAAFLSATNPRRWYGRLADRAGFIVTTDRSGFAAASMQSRLHDRFGSATDAVPAVSHYRAIYTTADQSLTIFALVPGATVRGTGPANRSLVATTTVTLPPAETEVQYTIRARTGPDGTFEFVTPYPGRYDIGNRSIRVPAAAVQSGKTVRVNGTRGAT